VTARDRAGGFVLMARDVTDAARVRHDLEASAVRAQALVERLQDGIAVVRDGRIETANPAFASILGLSIAEVEGAPLKRFVAAPDVMMALDHLRRATPDGVTSSLRLLRSDALDPRETLATLTALPGGECLVVVRDLTESRRAERRLEQARGRLDATLTGITQGVLAVEPRDGLRVSFANPPWGPDPEYPRLPPRSPGGGGAAAPGRNRGPPASLPGVGEHGGARRVPPGARVVPGRGRGQRAGGRRLRTSSFPAAQRAGGSMPSMTSRRRRPPSAICTTSAIACRREARCSESIGTWARQS
jgi:PAS domain S-box-containing protein